MDKKTSALRALFEKHREIIMYLIFGFATTAVSWVSYSLCVLLFQDSAAIESLSSTGFWSFFAGIFGENMKIVVVLSNVISWIIAVIFAFVTNKLWVFNSRSWQGRLVAKEAAAFVGGRAVTGVLEIVAVPLLVSFGLNQTLFGVEGLPAKMIVSIVIVILNYVIGKFFAFKVSKE